MPKKQKAPPETTDDTLLVSAAKAIGTAAGKIASLAGAAPAKSTKKGKLPKKNKRRVPRLQKKAQRKAEASQRA
jgi:hypothetical protein